jgi:hypothetical protein
MPTQAINLEAGIRTFNLGSGLDGKVIRRRSKNQSGQARRLTLLGQDIDPKSNLQGCLSFANDAMRALNVQNIRLSRDEVAGTIDEKSPQWLFKKDRADRDV